MKPLFLCANHSDPVITPEGYLYDREAILEYIVKQKLAIAKKQKAFEKQQKDKRDDELKPPEAKKLKHLTSIKNNEDKPALPSFWIPSLTPQVSNLVFFWLTYLRLAL